ncbi:unnamed protein product [Symbiodinium sp. CCMP2592]|nr:unnamed protein product [Symbiodinium sp. CCMP2592]
MSSCCSWRPRCTSPRTRTPRAPRLPIGVQGRCFLRSPGPGLGPGLPADPCSYPRLMICGIAGSTRMNVQHAGFHVLAQVLAAHEVWSIDPVDELRVQGLLSVAQNLVSTPWLTQLLERCTAPAELMLVGWSYGNHFACHAARQLETLGISLRGICALDDRASKPPRGVVDPDHIFQTRPRVRISTAALEFVSPCHFVRKESGLDPVRLIFGTNDEMAMKRALYFERSCKVWLSESVHHDIAVVSSWDIRERLHEQQRQSRRKRRRMPRVFGALGFAAGRPPKERGAVQSGCGGELWLLRHHHEPWVTSRPDSVCAGRAQGFSRLRMGHLLRTRLVPERMWPHGSQAVMPRDTVSTCDRTRSRMCTAVF